MMRMTKKVLGVLLSLALILEIVPISVVQAAEEENAAVTVEAPVFSAESGNYEKAFKLTLSATEGTTIYYSTDGSVPSPERLAEGNANIYTYESPISVKDRTGEANVLATPENCLAMNQEGNHEYAPTDEQVAKSTVIRAMAVDADGNCSDVVTKTYFVGSNLTTNYKDVAVISMVTDPKNLMDDEIGIFVTGNHDNYNQHGRDWERETYMDFYEPDGQIGFGMDLGIRVRGGYTRKYQQKSFNVYFREDYGQKNLKYNLIPGATNYEGTEETKKYKGFMLRSGGNDTNLTKLRDVYLQSRMRDRNIATQSHRPCVVYLNGEYWGLYNLQEKYDDNWMEEEFGINKDNLVLIKDAEVEEGEDADIALYEELRKLGDLDMSKEENYQKFLDAVDVQSYMDYYAVEILAGNRDWGLSKNNQFWRSRTVGESKYEDGKWRWILHDIDMTMNLYGQTPGDIITAMKETGEDGIAKDPLFLAVMENDSFKQSFTNTVMDLLNENLNYDKYLSDYEAVRDFYATLMQEQYYRYGNDWNGTDMNAFNTSAEHFTTAWKGMLGRAKTMLKKHMGAKTLVDLSVSSGDAKVESINVNTLDVSVKEAAWTGKYYKEMPVTITAPTVDGYKPKWEITGATTETIDVQTIRVTFTESDASVKLSYEENSAGGPGEIEPQPGPSVKPDDDTEKAVKAPKKATIKKVTSPKKKIMKVAIKKIKAKGYQIVYATNKKFTKGKGKKLTKKTTLTIKKLRSKKTYYVKVRAYNVKANGKKVYGKFSKVKKVKVK